MSSPNPYSPKTKAKAKARLLTQSIALRRQTHALQRDIISKLKSTHPHILALPQNRSRSWLDSKLQEKAGINLDLPPLLYPFPSQSHSHHMLWLTPIPSYAIPTSRAKYMARYLSSLGHAHAFVTSVAKAQVMIHNHCIT